MPDFSIVTISFNQAIYLEKCITSVLGQTGASFEYIVVDPGSTDGSREIISRYAGEIDTILLEPDNGPADGLNNGFQAATGRYLITINADDFLLPFALEKIFSLLSASSFPEILFMRRLACQRQGRAKTADVFVPVYAKGAGQSWIINVSARHDHPAGAG